MKVLKPRGMIALTAITVLPTTSCSGPIPPQELFPSGVAPAPQAAGATVELRRFSGSAENYRLFSGLSEPGFWVLRDEGSWRALWERLVLGIQPHPGPPPAVDFEREMVLVAAMGSQPTGGYLIQIRSVAEVGNSLVATVIRTAPGPSCGVIQAITRPVDLVRIDRSDKPVRWSVTESVREC